MSMGLDVLPKLGYQSPEKSNGVRALSEEERLEKQKEQDIARRNANLRKTDGGVFFLEYFRYRDKKVSQSPVKMAQVMAKTKTDNLSKTASEDNVNKSENDMVQAVAEKLGVSAEQLTVTVNGTGEDPAAFSAIIKDLAGMASREATEEKYQGRMISEKDYGDPDEKKPDWAAKLRAQAGRLEAAALTLQNGGVTTGTVPGAASMYKQVALYQRVADYISAREGIDPGQ